MLTRIISIALLLFGAIPAFFLFAHLSKALNVYNNAEYAPINTQGIWIPLQNNQNVTEISNPADVCYYTTDQSLLAQRISQLDDWRQTYKGLYTAGLYFSFLFYMGLRCFSGLLEYILSRRKDRRLVWLGVRLIIIALTDALAFKVLHSYRLIAFVDFAKCLGPVSGSDFVLDLEHKQLVSRSGNWLLSFLNYKSWETIQATFYLICAACVAVGIFRFRRSWLLLTFLLVAGGVVLVTLGAVGGLFYLALLELNNEGYSALVNEINTIMSIRLLVAILESILAFLYSPVLDGYLNDSIHTRRAEMEKTEVQALSKGVPPSTEDVDHPAE